jgi:RNA polymerase subunit RPABC4/transcription elongation factor Spt4
MATDSTRTQPAVATSNAAHAAVLTQDAGVRRMEAASAPGAIESTRKPSGYGLPCAKCRLYYPADLDICPTCHHRERVSPVAPSVPPKVAQAVTEAAPADSAVLEQEREEFLRQFKSQLMQAHIGVSNAPAATTCNLGERHAGEPESAEICRHCYDRMQERLDVCEAALHLDLKEAAQIIYDAVWADPSDPSKTYQNAANALLVELRKRSGMATLRGPFHPLSH